MDHLRLRGTHYQIGVTQGVFLNRKNISFPLHLDHFQFEHGKESEKLLRKLFPEVCEEIRGLCDTICAEYIEFSAWMLCMGCCMYNLANNVPVEVKGCTAFALQRGGRILYGRNNDLPPFLRDQSKSVLYMPNGGNRFLMTTSSLINGEEGLNEYGLAVAMTFVMTRPDKIRPGFNSSFIVRYLLEKSNRVKDAVSLLWELPIASNCNILLADKSGDMVVVECTAKGKRIRQAEPLPDGKIVCTVNSFTSDALKSCDDAHEDDYASATRYRVVMENAPRLVKSDLDGEIMRLLRGEYGFMCQYDNEPNFETVWSSIFDLKSLLVHRAEGDPRKTPFILDKGLHDPDRVPV